MLLYAEIMEIVITLPIVSNNDILGRSWLICFHNICINILYDMCIF